ncbi:PREDICTED: RNA-directed DNA polymerase from mobile element jockey-like [Dufourea novaeangliae]|uniref:RNA-directed DNA polymerase from mobile element jockey-like n=1 Tax=Dufourea novaeangliae TaxID=178035 RepID=UPI000767C32E|nr:PREDICTED: RNA-directed DNA polymerase from mobile element jockey-like [Dufourea novaeangliae]
MELEENAPAPGNTGSNNQKTPKPPPIYAVKTDIQAIIKIIKSTQIPETVFAVKEVNKENHTIYINQLEYHQEIVNKLRAESSSNYTLPAEKSNVHHYSATANRSEPHFNNNQQSCQPPKWIQDFKNEIASLFSNQLQTLAAQIASNTTGDINARRKAWGDRLHNQRGRYMRQWEDSFGITFKLKIITSSESTFKPHNSFLDICLADARLKLDNALNGKAQTLPYDSEHAAISVTFELSNDNTPLWNPVPEQYRFNFKATNWQIDSNLEHINNVIHNTIISTVPKIKPGNSIHRYLNHNIRKLLKIKSYPVSLLHDLHITDPHSSRTISVIAKEALKDTSRAIQLEFKISTDKYWNNKIKKIDYSNREAFFSKINAIFRAKQISHIENLHVKLNDSGTLLRSKCDLNNVHKTANSYIFTAPQDKLNIIGSFYEAINSPRYLNTNTPLKQVVDATAEDIKNRFKNSRDSVSTITLFNRDNVASNPNPPDTQPQPFCSLGSIELILKSLPNKTSSGLDNIPPIVLKHLPRNMKFDLIILFNNSINHHYFPKIWKRAKVLPILKKNKNPSDPSSYRPINLTPSLTKVFESIINSNINEFCNINKIIPDHQFGFKHQHSTTHAIHKFMSDLNTLVAKSQIVGAAFLDIEKAFDSVWLNGLLYKLNKKQCPTWLIYQIWDMINNNTFLTWDGENLSTEEFRITEGLQQGTVNSPILFNILLSDLPRLFNLNENRKSSALASADDLIVYTYGNKVKTVRDNLEEIVEKINQYYVAWNLRLNPSKCETILFRKPLDNLSSKVKAGSREFQICTTIPSTINKENIPHKKVVKYLGIHIDYLLRGNKHIDIQINKAKIAFQSNCRIFYNKYLSNKTKVILYMLLVRPILTYAAPIWWNCNNTVVEKIRMFERKCLRACIRINRSQQSDWQHFINNKTIYNKAGIPRIDSFIIKLTRDYFSKLPLIKNSILQTLSIHDPILSQRQITNGYLSPQAFIHCDKLGLIQNAYNINLIYHWRRNKANKRIAFHHSDFNINNNNFKFSLALPDIDIMDFHRLNFKKYWWLSINDNHIADLRERRISSLRLY